jgi:DNA replication protein DnaC
MATTPTSWSRPVVCTHRRWEKSSIILTSKLPFSGWGQVFGEATIASALIHRTAAAAGPEHRQPRQTIRPQQP